MDGCVTCGLSAYCYSLTRSIIHSYRKYRFFICREVNMICFLVLFCFLLPLFFHSLKNITFDFHWNYIISISMWIISKGKKERVFPLQSFVISFFYIFFFLLPVDFVFFWSIWRSSSRTKATTRQTNTAYKKLKVLFGCWHIRCFFYIERALLSPWIFYKVVNM